MPLIRRKITHEIPALHSKTFSDSTFYVKPRDVQPGDVVIKPEEMRTEVLADLAKMYPKEYAKEAARLNALDVDDDEIPPTGDEDLDEDDDEVNEFSPEQVDFLSLEAKDAIARIEAIADDDVDTLAALFEAEISRPKARKTVLEAFAAKGMQ